MNDRSTFEEQMLVDALALPADARRAFIERRCGATDDTAGRLIALLQGYQDNSAYLETPAPAAALQSVGRVFAALPPEPRPGDHINHYHLLKRIGEGGFGVVYLAEQEEPVRRLVALKVIRLGLDTREFIARFEAERQALAVMDHPNIARVFDAGATDSGRPYLVMELIRGIPITAYCDEHRLSVTARLGLFLQVCGAIQHAHQKGIIHCDLKPSNILIERHDPPEAGCPKVIDFGIAKATPDRLAEQTLFTRFHALIGTPAYTSPEQMELSGLDVDTRSDIYALGVLLYELLSGQQPFDRDALERTSLEEMRRVIRDVDPPRPSARVSALERDERARITQRRGLEPEKLAPLLRSDLDWIVMRCLEKDRTRRYETANGLAMDLRRHLACEPVVARPPTRTYRLGKFVRRNRTLVVAGTAVAIALIAGLALAAAGFARAQTQQHATETARREAEDLVSFMVKDLKPELQRVGRLPLTAQVAEKAVRYFANLPPDLNNAATERNRAVALEALAGVRSASGNADSAGSLWHEAVAARHRALAVAPNDPLLAVELALTEAVEVSRCYPLVPLQAWGMPGPPEVDARLGAIVDNARAACRDHLDEPQVARAFAQLLVVRSDYLSGNTSRPAEALSVAREAEVLYRKLLDCSPNDIPQGVELVRLMLGIATATQQVGNDTEAVAVAREAATRADTDVENNPGNIALQENAAYAQLMLSYRLSGVSLEQSSEAEAVARKRYQALVQMDPQNVAYQHDYARAHVMEGFFLQMAGRATEARHAFQRFVDLLAPIAQSPTDFQSLRTGTLRIAALAAQAGDADTAQLFLAASREWDRKYLASLAPEAVRLPAVRLGYLDESCNALGLLGDWRAVERDARALFTAVIEARRSDPHDANLLLQGFDGAYWLGQSLIRLGFAQEAVTILQRSLDESDELSALRIPGVDMNEALLELNDLLGEALIAAGHVPEARALLEADLAGWEKLAKAQPNVCGDMGLGNCACLLATALDPSDPRDAGRRVALLERASSILEKLSPGLRLCGQAKELSQKIKTLRAAGSEDPRETSSDSANSP